MLTELRSKLPAVTEGYDEIGIEGSLAVRLIIQRWLKTRRVFCFEKMKRFVRK